MIILNMCVCNYAYASYKNMGSEFTAVPKYITKHFNLYAHVHYTLFCCEIDVFLLAILMQYTSDVISVIQNSTCENKACHIILWKMVHSDINEVFL